MREKGREREREREREKEGGMGKDRCKKTKKINKQTNKQMRGAGEGGRIKKIISTIYNVLAPIQKSTDVHVLGSHTLAHPLVLLEEPAKEFLGVPPPAASQPTPEAPPPELGPHVKHNTWDPHSSF